MIAPLAGRGYFSGVVLVEEDGAVVLEKAYGMANVELAVPNRVDTRIGVASITKLMTAVILSRLIEADAIHLDDTVARFLPDFPRGDEITVSMLARHRSGIPHRVLPTEQETLPHSTAEMVDWIAESDLEFTPGSKRSYSSAGYTLLARLLELASGRRYAELLEQYVFQPAQMTDSMEYDGASIIERRAADYLLTREGVVNAPPKDLSFLAGAGSVVGTARDLERFARAVLDGTYGQSVKEQLAPEGVFRASGRTNGHRAYLTFNDTTASGYVLLSNIASGAFDVISTRLGAILAGSRDIEAFRMPELATDSERNLTEFVGTYDRTGGSAFEIVLKDGVLHSGDIAIYPTTEPDCFFDFLFFGDVCFGRDETRKVVSIVWKGEGYELEGIKK
jgi:CubicO group peptidase (beta-lactamase class C family)